MTLEHIADKLIETDVLVVGGGIAGCPAAAKAAEHGLKVTLAEKSKTDRSGSAAQGIDHFGGAYPRGMTTQDWVELCEREGDRAYDIGGPSTHPTRLYRQYAAGQWAIEELEKLGVTMKWTDGELRPIVCHHPGPFIRVHWQNVKPQMAAGVRKRGVNVLDRTMVIDLLTNNGAVVGATAINSRTGEFIVIKAKAVIITTGNCARPYNPDNPAFWKYKMRYHWCPASISGDGWAMAYRAGAELANMEQAGRGARFRDDLVLSFGNHGNEGIPAKRLSWDGVERIRGEGGSRQRTRRPGMQPGGRDDPSYIGIDHLPDDFHKRIEVAYVDERMVSFKIAEDRGFNPKTHWYEIMEARPNQFEVSSGINTDGDSMSSLKGLFAAGDCATGEGGVARSATSGLLVGDSIHTFVNETKEPIVDEAQVESQRQTVLAPLSVKDGTEPMELESAIRYICDRYVGVSRAEGRLREGMRRIGTLRRVFLPKLTASNPHYLMRCLEVRNVMELAQVHIQACLERKETRGNHIRLDYPDINPAWDDLLLYQRLEDKKVVFDMRKLPPLDMNVKEER